MSLVLKAGTSWAETYAQCVSVAPEAFDPDRIRNLISFLDGVGGNRRKRLLDIPWTPANRVSQRDHYVDQILDIP